MKRTKPMQKAILIGTAFVLALVFFVLAFQAEAVDPETSPFGIRGLNKHGWDVEKRDKAMALAKAAGVHWHRSVLFWYQVEPKNDRFTWDETDALVNAAEKHGIRLMVTIRSVSPWGAKGSKRGVLVPHKKKKRKVSNMPDRLEDYVDFLKKTATRYKGRIRHWQIENEPAGKHDYRFWAGSAQEYVQLLKTAYDAIKSVDTGNKVLVAGFTAASLIKDHGNGFLSSVLKAGGGEHFDIFDYHAYGKLAKITKAGKRAQEILESHGFAGQKAKPMWLSETSTRGNTPRLWEVTQAQDVIKRYCLAFANGVERVFWWYAVDKASKPVVKEKKSNDYSGLLDIGLRPKPAYHAYCLMTSKLEGFDSVRKLELARGVEAFSFTKGVNMVYVLWGLSSKNVSLSFHQDKATVTDIHGRETIVPTKDGKIDLPLSDSPIFVE